MGAPGWDRQGEPPARGGRSQTAANYDTPVSERELAQYDQAWRAAEVKEPGSFGASKPDGDYIGQITAARMERTRQQGTPMLTITMNILAGAPGGTYAYRRVLRDTDSVRYLKQDLHNLGMDVDLLSALPAYLEGLIDVCVAFTLKSASKNGKTYQNTYLNRALGPEEVDGEIERLGAQEAEGDVPF